MPARPRSHATNGGGTSDVDWVLAGRAYVAGRLQPVEIGIDDEGWIRRVARHVGADRRRDVGEAVILPSATDLHVHFREPGSGDAAENFASGTLQAAYGGVGTVADMPNTEPPITDPDRLRDKAARVPGRAHVDVLLYAALAPGVRVRSLARHAGAFKLYLSPTTGQPEATPFAATRGLLAAAAETGLFVSVHAEDPAHFRDAPAATVEGWNASRPALAERRAVAEVLSAAPPSLRLHIAHVTQAEIVDDLRRTGHSFETTPHHLLLSHRHGPDARFKVNPPLRREAERRELLAAFDRGQVPCLASDHAPHSAEAKGRPFANAPSGMPGVETLLPLMLGRVREGALPFPTLVAAACERPARWAGLPQGRLAPGHRANLLVVDFRRTVTVHARALHAPCGWTAFEGFSAVFPREHYRDGQPLLVDGEYVGRPSGRVVRPEYAP